MWEIWKKKMKEKGNITCGSVLKLERPQVDVLKKNRGEYVLRFTATAWLWRGTEAILAAGFWEVWQENVLVVQYAGSIICSLLFFLDAPSFCILYVSFVKQLSFVRPLSRLAKNLSWV